MTRYIAWVEADGGIGFDYDGDVDEAEEYLKKTVSTGDLGPPKVNVEVDNSKSESSARNEPTKSAREVDE